MDSASDIWAMVTSPTPAARLRILLLTTVFPPVNATGARRPFYMARRLCDEGHEVTVVSGRRLETQPWNADLRGIRSIVLDLTDHPPAMSGWQRYLADRHRKLRGTFLHGPVRVLADLLLPLEHATRWPVTPDDLAKELGPQDVVIATGPGWSTFQFGHQLASLWKATFIADYRDPWSIKLPEVALHTVTHLGGALTGRLRRWRMLKDERRFTANATGITAATPVVLQNALRVIGDKPGYVMLNGFEPHHRAMARERNALFTLVYTGSIYREQEWDIVSSGLHTLATTRPDIAKDMQLIVAGARTSHDPELRAVERWMGSAPQVLRMERLDREGAAALQSKADLLLHVGFKGKKGIFPIKFIEYLNAGPPVLQVSTGHDMMEEALQRTGCGFVVNTSETLAALLIEHVEAWRTGNPVRCAIRPDALNELTWSNQTKGWYQFIMGLHEAGAGHGPQPPTPARQQV